MQVKDVPVAVKAGPDDGLGDGEFTAYASTFDVVDSYGEVVVKGAFESDLARWKASGNPIPLLFGHVMSDPDFNLGAVIEAAEDDRGLLIKGQLDLENPKSLQTYRMLKGRRINQMSFAYDVIADGTRKLDDGRSVRELRELKVYEVSVVTIGANQDTEILAVKAAATALAAKAGRVLSAKNEATLRDVSDQLKAAGAAITDVLSAVESGSSGKANENQEQASGSLPAATVSASAKEPSPATAPVEAKEPQSGPSVDSVLTLIEVSSI